MHDDRHFRAVIRFYSQTNNTITSNVTGIAKL